MSRKHDEQIADMVGKPIGEKIEKIEEAVRSDGERTRAEFEGVKQCVDIVLDDLSAREKKELYDLNTMVDIADLDDTEKEFLLAVLYTLSNMAEEVTNMQQAYIRSVKKYLDIKNVQTEVDLSRIENIDSKRQTKAILQTVMEFLFLENFNHDYQDEYEDVLDYFDVKASEVRKIQKAIDAIYKAVGAEGLAEKYGFVVEETVMKETPVTAEQSEKKVKYSMSVELADELAGRIFSGYVETEHYVMVDRLSSGEKGGYRIDKATGEQVKIFEDKEIGRLDAEKCAVYEDCVVFHNESSAYWVNLVTMEKKNLPLKIDYYGIKPCLSKRYYITSPANSREIQVTDLNKNETFLVLDENRERVRCESAVLNGDYLYYINGASILTEYNLLKKQKERECVLPDEFVQPHLIAVNEDLYIYDEYNKNYDKTCAVYYVELGRENINVEKRISFDYLKYLCCRRDGCLLFVGAGDDFPLYLYKFGTNELLHLANGCKDIWDVKLHFFSKRTKHEDPGTFKMIGPYVYYTDSFWCDNVRRNTTYRVSLENMQVCVFSE